MIPTDGCRKFLTTNVNLKRIIQFCVWSSSIASPVVAGSITTYVFVGAVLNRGDCTQRGLLKEVCRDCAGEALQRFLHDFLEGEIRVCW